MAELTTLENLNRIYAKLEGLKHIKKSNHAYGEAQSIATELKYLLPHSNNIRLDIGKLDIYRLKGSDKSKEAVIEEFKSETLFDLRTIINNVERSGKPPIED